MQESSNQGSTDTLHLEKNSSSLYAHSILASFLIVVVTHALSHQKAGILHHQIEFDGRGGNESLQFINEAPHSDSGIDESLNDINIKSSSHGIIPQPTIHDMEASQDEAKIVKLSYRSVEVLNFMLKFLTGALLIGTLTRYYYYILFDARKVDLRTHFRFKIKQEKSGPTKVECGWRAPNRDEIIHQEEIKNYSVPTSLLGGKRNYPRRQRNDIILAGGIPEKKSGIKFISAHLSEWETAILLTTLMTIPGIFSLPRVLVGSQLGKTGMMIWALFFVASILCGYFLAAVQDLLITEGEGSESLLVHIFKWSMGYCCGLFVASLLAIHVIGTTLIAMSVYLSACKHKFPEIPITIPIGLAAIIWSTSVNMSNRLNKNGIRMLSILGVISLLISELIRVRISGITGFLMILAADNSVVPSISKEIAPDTLEKWNDEQILELIFEVGIILLGSGGLVLPHLPYLKNCMKEPKKFGKVFGIPQSPGWEFGDMERILTSYCRFMPVNYMSIASRGKVSIYVFTMVFGVIASCILFEEFKCYGNRNLIDLLRILGIGLSSSIFLKECWAYEVGIWRWVPVSILILDSALLTCISNLCAIVL
eukprot:jgi/Bigna1/131798/aug1.15_g6506